VSAQPPGLAARTPPAVQPEESALGVKRFLHNNETLIKMGSLVFAASGVLRAQPKDDAVALLQTLLIVIGLIIFLRLWKDLPRRYGMLPGSGWTLGLTLLYYCLTISLIVGIVYITGNLAEQRYKYLAILLGTLLAIGGVSWLTYQANLERALLGWLGGRGHEAQVGLLVGILLLLLVTGAYLLAAALAPPLNVALDQLFGPPPPPTQPSR
jgi:hypothetical protein